jgi:hypothetical protein
MSVIWHTEPAFPVEHLLAGTKRYRVGAHWVDWDGPGQPTQADVDAILGTDATGLAEKARTQGINAAIDNDTELAALKVMSNDELDAWFVANVNDMAAARKMLRRLFKIVIQRVL